MKQSEDFTTKLRPAGPGGAAIIAQERARSTIPVDELSKYLLGQDFLGRQHHMLDVLTNNKLFSKTTQMNLSRPERYMLGLARAKTLRRLADQHEWGDDDYDMARYLVDDVSPYTLHQTMFRQTLREQTSDEQREYWLPRHQRWEIIGSYAQTEMGHGSNVRGIETEARWDPQSKEFILHSPTLTASKWWNGSLGRTANHAIIVAQLLLPKPGTSGPNMEYDGYGPHPFVVQVRDMKTHLPLEGIVIGDIGPKYGYAPMDNAYMLLNHIRVPHSAMLSRYSRVDPETGKYSKPANPNVVYGSLTHARSSIVMHARLILARAVTVAIRYTSIRCQFKDKDSLSASNLETAVLDYSTVQIRLLPLLATTFALHFSGQKMKEHFLSTRQNVEKGDFSGLVELHGMSSGLKSLCTDLAAGGIEICRRAMGGHGYGGYSGLVQLNADYLSKPTVEGDNWMITQQVARYLIKTAKRVVSSPNATSENRTEASLRRCWNTRDKPASDLLDDNTGIVQAFEHRAAYLTFKAYNAYSVLHNPWNDLLIEMHKLSQAQSYALLIQNFHSALSHPQAVDLDSTIQSVLHDLFRLFAFTTLEASSLEFLTSGAITREQLASLPSRILALMRRIRPHAVRLVDAWAIPDYLLDSSLGRYDGNVYEDMFHRAHRLNPLNNVTFNPDYRSEEIVMGSGDGGAILSKM